VCAVQAQFPFDGLTQILDEMKPIGDLHRGRRARAGGLGVAAVAVATDGVDRRMGDQPLFDGLAGMRVEHVDHGAMFQIHHDRAVRSPFALGPFIDSDDSHASDGRPGALLQPAQDGVITDRQAEAAT
jgi:hypothetical protein